MMKAHRIPCRARHSRIRLGFNRRKACLLKVDARYKYRPLSLTHDIYVARRLLRKALIVVYLPSVVVVVAADQCSKAFGSGRICVRPHNAWPLPGPITHPRLLPLSLSRTSVLSLGPQCISGSQFASPLAPSARGAATGTGGGTGVLRVGKKGRGPCSSSASKAGSCSRGKAGSDGSS